MKNKLLQMIFKKELENAYKELNDCYRREKQKIEYAMRQNEKQYGLMKRIFYLFPNAEIVGIEKNKKDEELIVVVNKDTIYLFGERYQGISNLPRIYFNMYSEFTDIVEKKYIHIIDVLMEDNDIGNGTIAMNALIKYAKKNNVKWIDGKLSSVDNDHADRRNHYYEKFGFVISESSIKLVL